MRSRLVSGTAGAASIPGTNVLCPIMPALCALQSGLNPEGSKKHNFFILFFGLCIFIIEGRTDQRNAQINFSLINLLLFKLLRHVSAT